MEEITLENIIDVACNIKQIRTYFIKPYDNSHTSCVYYWSVWETTCIDNTHTCTCKQSISINHVIYTFIAFYPLNIVMLSVYNHCKLSWWGVDRIFIRITVSSACLSYFLVQSISLHLVQKLRTIRCLWPRLR